MERIGGWFGVFKGKTEKQIHTSSEKTESPSETTIHNNAESKTNINKLCDNMNGTDSIKESNVNNSSNVTTTYSTVELSQIPKITPLTDKEIQYGNFSELDIWLRQNVPIRPGESVQNKVRISASLLIMSTGYLGFMIASRTRLPKEQRKFADIHGVAVFIFGVSYTYSKWWNRSFFSKENEEDINRSFSRIFKTNKTMDNESEDKKS